MNSLEPAFKGRAGSGPKLRAYRAANTLAHPDLGLELNLSAHVLVNRRPGWAQPECFEADETTKAPPIG